MKGTRLPFCMRRANTLRQAVRSVVTDQMQREAVRPIMAVRSVGHAISLIAVRGCLIFGRVFKSRIKDDRAYGCLEKYTSKV